MSTLPTRRRLSTLVGASLVAALGLLIPGRAEAQQAATSACYVPDVGAIYLIGQPGLPTACLDASHTEIALVGAVAGRQIVTQSFNVSPGTSTDITAVCPTGKVALGGGFDAVVFPGLVPYGSHPVDVNGTGDAWNVSVQNTGSFNIGVTAFAICAEA